MSAAVGGRRRPLSPGAGAGRQQRLPPAPPLSPPVRVRAADCRDDLLVETSLVDATRPLRLPMGATMDDIPANTLEDCAQLVKQNSIQGCKTNGVTIVYTPWSNLKKTAAMEVGQVGFHSDKSVRKVKVRGGGGARSMSSSWSTSAAAAAAAQQQGRLLVCRISWRHGTVHVTRSCSATSATHRWSSGRRVCCRRCRSLRPLAAAPLPPCHASLSLQYSTGREEEQRDHQPAGKDAARGGRPAAGRREGGV